MSELKDYKRVSMKQVDKSTQLCIRVSAKTRAKIDYLSSYWGVSVSTVMRCLIDDGLEERMNRIKITNDENNE